VAEPPKKPNLPSDLELDDEERAAFEELGIDLDQVTNEVGKLAPQKVELDTAGLDLEGLEEPPPPPVQKEPEVAIEAEPAEEEPAKSARPGWFWPVVLGGTGLVAAAVFLLVGYLTWWAKPPAVAEKKPPETAEVVLLTVALPDFTVPLKVQGRSLLRLSLELSLTSEAAKKQVLSQRTKVRDTIYQVLLKEGQSEMKTNEEKMALREAIQGALNQRLEGRPVKEVLFTDFLVL
jgi:flagellar basal body-associated protein FliL